MLEAVRFDEAVSPVEAVTAATSAPALAARGLAVYAGKRALLRGVDLEVAAGTVCALVGPSGVGKTTLLRCFNRLVDLVAGLRVEGEVAIGGRSVYAPGVDPDQLRARVGMLFQQPVVFPKSIYENVLFGLRRVGPRSFGRGPRRQWPQRAEAALRQVGLWDQVHDRLREPAGELSVGQQQRLCLARALVLEPVALLMDEPTSALDPESTAAIERLMRRLASRTTVLLVTHDHGQAARVADRIVRMELRDGVGVIAEATPNAAALASPLTANTDSTGAVAARRRGSP
jgi:phosphate transport system ATP-binding protein